MECPRCKHELSFDEYISIFKNQKDAEIPLTFSPVFVLKNHDAFRASISTKKNELIFFENDHPKKMQFNRPVLLKSITIPHRHDDLCEDCRRSKISLIEMKLNHVHQDQQLALWIMTQPEPTNAVDGAIYFVVRDEHDFHIRLSKFLPMGNLSFDHLLIVIRNWSYVLPVNASKTREELIDILNELLPIGSMIKLNDPLLTKCHLDGQLSLRCDSPNIELILSDRIQKYFVDANLNEVRERGNQAYIRGHMQLAIDYYTFAINRIVTMAGMVISNDNPCEMDLFRGAFQADLSRLHSNRSACYLREQLYPGASLDAFVVMTGRLCNQTFDDFFLKCLHRLMCATIGLQEFKSLPEGCFELAQHPSINFNLRMRYTEEFERIRTNLPRLKEESKKGKYDLKQMFNDASINPTSLFDIHLFHCDFNNHGCIKKRTNRMLAKCSIPAGTLLLAQRAFAYVPSNVENPDRRLINEIEKRLIMAPTVWEFDSIRMMPTIDRWFETETDADEDDYEFVPFAYSIFRANFCDSTYPQCLPWGLLVKTQRENPFRSKSLVGWWPEVSVFKFDNDSRRKGNCLWFICGKTIFLFTINSLNKNDEFLIATNSRIRSFLVENRKQFTFRLGNNHHRIPLDDLFDHLERTQIYFAH